VVYLVSDDARYVTGIAMPVDGGFLASGARGL
jgi:3-oxoacyl-[acyl-carrier protein] reductase